MFILDIHTHGIHAWDWYTYLRTWNRRFLWFSMSVNIRKSSMDPMGCHDVTTCDKRENRPRLKIIKETLAGWHFVNHEIGICFCLKESCMSTKEFSLQTYRSHQTLSLAACFVDISNYSSVQAVFFQSGIVHAKWISWSMNRTFLDMSLHSEVVNSRVFRSYLVRMCLDPHTPAVRRHL